MNFTYKLKTFSPLLLVLLIFFLYFFTLVNFFPFIWDDYGVSTLKIADSPFLNYHRLTIIVSALKMWFFSHANSRVGAGIYTIVGQFPKIYSTILLTLVILAFNLLMFFYIFTKLPNYKNFKCAIKDALILAIIFILFIAITPYITISVLWRAAALEHLIGQTLLLLFYVPYYLMFYNKKWQPNFIIVILYTIAGFFIAFTTENIVPIFVMLIAVAILYSFRKNHKLPAWSIIGSIGFLLGFARMVYYYFFTHDSRLEDNLKIHHQTTFFSLKSFYDNLQHHIIFLVHEYHIFFYFCLIIVIVFIVKMLKSRHNHKFNLSYPGVKLAIYGLIFLFSILLLMLVPYRSMQPRVLPFQTFLIIAIIVFFVQYLIQNQLLLKNKITIGFGITIFTVFIIFAVIQMINIYRVVDSFSVQNRVITTNIINTSKKVDKNATIVFPIPKIIPNFKIAPIFKQWGKLQLSGFKHYYNIPQNLVSGSIQ